MERNPQLQERIAAEAAEWFARLQDVKEAPAIHEEFVEWLLRSPEHLEEFLAVSRVWGAADAASGSRFSTDALIAAALAERAPDNVIALKNSASQGRATDEGVPVRHESRGRQRKYPVAAASAFVVVALGVMAWLATARWQDPSHIRTAVGEQRSVTLADGSVLDINTDSEVRVDIEGAERRLRLLRGEARFKVARDPLRPFIVSTREASIRALGTVFNVRAESAQTAVAVLEGHVEVRGRAQPEAAAGPASSRIELKAGQQVAVSPAGRIVPNVGPPLERVAAWTQRRLVFRETPLAEVVAEFNRYHRKPIRIEAPELAGLRISGTFDSGDPRSLLEYFAHFESVKVEESGDSVRLMLPAP